LDAHQNGTNPLIQACECYIWFNSGLMWPPAAESPESTPSWCASNGNTNPWKVLLKQIFFIFV
jgi:hypothetical protein